MISIKQSQVTGLNVAIKPASTLMGLGADRPINLCIVLIELYTSSTHAGGPTAPEAWDSASGSPGLSPVLAFIEECDLGPVLNKEPQPLSHIPSLLFFCFETGSC